jgi:hypothetical protein
VDLHGGDVPTCICLRRAPDHACECDQYARADEARDEVTKPAAENDAKERENEVSDNGEGVLSKSSTSSPH